MPGHEFTIAIEREPFNTLLRWRCSLRNPNGESIWSGTALTATWAERIGRSRLKSHLRRSSYLEQLARSSRRSVVVDIELLLPAIDPEETPFEASPSRASRPSSLAGRLAV